MHWHLPSLSALRTFEAAERHMSFTKAAVELNLTQSAVSRQIRLMEDYLGVELFQRVNQRLAVTEAGRAYAEEVRRVLHSLQEATLRLMSYQEQGGILHIATPSVFGVKWLIPRLHSFYSKHPDILLNIVTRSKPFDLESEKLDVAIHWGNNDWPNVVAHPLVGRELVPVCSPAYLQSIGTVKAPGDLAKAALLQHARRPNRWQEWFDAHGAGNVNAWAGARFEHFYLITQAAVAGLGVGLLPRMFVEDEVKSGRLVMLFDDGFEGSDIYHLVYPEHKSNDAKVGKFREWILKQAQEDGTKGSAA
ncbi:transcriptional regulator GcvA [Paracandidimonas soli]|nr:transcriptional regulator GcvA [Paracandidimonas soli]